MLTKLLSQDVIAFRDVLQSNSAFGLFALNELILEGNLSGVDNENNNLLHVALQEKHKASLRGLLMQDYENFDSKNSEGKTPLDIIKEDPKLYGKLFEGFLLPDQVIEVLGANLE